jgi:hypothetical protein
MDHNYTSDYQLLSDLSQLHTWQPAAFPFATTTHVTTMQLLSHLSQLHTWQTAAFRFVTISNSPNSSYFEVFQLKKIHKLKKICWQYLEWVYRQNMIREKSVSKNLYKKAKSKLNKGYCINLSHDLTITFSGCHKIFNGYSSNMFLFL